ncbi:MFS transporter [Vulgatibacter sp.]|uniref:MFS transporter n=1 Tax=Vulgatibacter sp. TaxID=1971226 RepID=UPI00356653B3
MAAAPIAASSAPMHAHPAGYRLRRFLNWFPLGLTYALLYMGRYNLTVAKTSLGDLMTKEDFGVIFGAGTFTYALAFLLNGPLVDRFGGRRGMLIAALGSMVANGAMGLYLQHVLSTGSAAEAPLLLVFSALYAANMYFQSFAAVSIVKVNAHWFHVTERGGFSGIFGTMISSGIFLAFTVNGWLLGTAAQIWEGKPSQWVVFLAPSLLLGVMAVVEFFLLRDSPGKAGFTDFDTGDASSGEEDAAPLPTREVFRRLLTNPVILTVAGIEFCTGVLRNGVMHWFPIYASEVWVLPKEHVFMRGSWDNLGLLFTCFGVAAVSGLLAAHASGRRRGAFAVAASLAFLAPFFQGGWGGLLFIAGVIGGNVAGWVSDLFFQSRRGPAAAGLYFFLALCTIGMIFALAPATNEVGSADPKSGLVAGDRILAIAGQEVAGWADVRSAVACVPAQCTDSGWDAAACTCSSRIAPGATAAPGVIAATVLRGGERLALDLPDPAPVMRAGDGRKLAAQPVLPISPWWLGALVFLLSLSVIGVHGLLSGTATMDFGGRRAAATATGVIDGFVYLGTAVQSLALGFLTSRSWSYWPLFLAPFAILGALLCLRIWNAKPKSARKAPAAAATEQKDAAQAA